MSWPHEDWIPAALVPAPFLADPHETVIACTDGSCNGQTRIGSWGYVMRVYGIEREVSEARSDTTVSVMEVTAALHAIEATHPTRPLIIISDAAYVVDNAFKYLRRWQRNGWMTTMGAPVANRALWERFAAALFLEDRHVHLHRVKGHAGHPGNERADKLCTKTVQAYMQDLLTPA